MESFLSQERSAASLNSVQSSDGSLISVFNSEAVAPTSSNTTFNPETSIDLSIGDPTFIQQLLNQEHLSPSLADLDLSDIFDDILSEKQPIDTNPEMILQSSIDIPEVAHSETVYTEPVQSTPMFVDSMMDETTTSSESYISEDYSHGATPRRTTQNNQNNDRKLARFGNKRVVKYSDEYHDRRSKNNEAVKKSRLKAKEKQKTTETQMSKLLEENQMLNSRLDSLTKELQFIRSLYKDLKGDTSNSKD